MNIGIIGAMAQEIEILSNMMRERQLIRFGSVSLYQGYIGDKRVSLLQSGIGKVAAAIGTAMLLHTAKPDVVINTGSAGGVAEGLQIGDIVVSTHCCHHDADVTAFGYAKGQLPANPQKFISDPELTAVAARIARAQGHRVQFGLICSGDSFIHGGEALARIKNDFPEVIAVEMEAAAIAQTCHGFNVPFVVVRAISDGGDGKAEMSFEEFLPIAAENSSQMVVAMLEQLGKKPSEE
ncbi:adenosylhomocysteine nucleosidase [Mesocricetibacter intestinalis]|uniref:5'-methylthioadenosine/S-adenosylhomocysteine nucleosidase n=1 Tax=Mesocricetibacter intestinalis TaxID=1521930 RepID=A0A4R6VAT5_9PAST|nr:5'-methylthioadenosine/adenosylhomocysteine nucleosidase [Mesocricetibacter intestinalis]TDQ57027.1 adenosylhomocysteine nucleosidase [Mesocricetibacter intestinalis]